LSIGVEHKDYTYNGYGFTITSVTAPYFTLEHFLSAFELGHPLVGGENIWSFSTRPFNW